MSYEPPNRSEHYNDKVGRLSMIAEAAKGDGCLPIELFHGSTPLTGVSVKLSLRQAREVTLQFLGRDQGTGAEFAGYKFTASKEVEDG